ncbi:hypothetical protein JXQ31_08010 [candidate division KSB1 bacterium]|nr:hypothetical protein [candidate division KSB1 bacterium]
MTKRRQRNSIIILSICIGIITLTVLGYSIYFYQKYFGFTPSINHQTWAEYGSFWGGILGPLFSFISILLLIITLKQQKMISNHQIFESSFFKLFELFERKRDSFRIEINKKKIISNINGKKCFEHIYDSLNKEFGKNNVKDVDQTRANMIYSTNFSQEITSNYEIYLNQLFSLIKYIDEYCFMDRKFYIDIVISNLWLEEHLILYIVCTFEMFQAYKKYVEKYSLMEKIFYKKFVQKYKEIFSLYDKKAFGKVSNEVYKRALNSI